MEGEQLLIQAASGDKSAIVKLGELVETHMKSSFGIILKALTVGKIAEQLEQNFDGRLSSDRILGRCEMANNLWNSLEDYVADKDRLLLPIPDTEPFNENIAEEPEPKSY